MGVANNAIQSLFIHTLYTVIHSTYTLCYNYSQPRYVLTLQILHELSERLQTYQDAANSKIAQLEKELAEVKQSTKSRINELEKKLADVEEDASNKIAKLEHMNIKISGKVANVASQLEIKSQVESAGQ